MAKTRLNDPTGPIHEHTVSSSTTLLPLLRPHLPYSIPLYRRVQFPQRSQHAHILATAPPPPSSREEAQKELGENDGTSSAVAACMAAAYIDRSRRPETEAWFFLAWDNPEHVRQTRAAPTTTTTGEATSEKKNNDRGGGACRCGQLLLALLHHAAIQLGPYPPLSAEDEADALAAVAGDSGAKDAARFHGHTAASAAQYLTHLHDEASLKAGTLHARGVQMLRAEGCLRLDLPGAEFPYRKYWFAAAETEAGAGRDAAEDDAGSLTPPPPPEGFRWGTVREQDISLVRSRTAIPRTHRTLRTLPSVALFPHADDEAAQPVAWAFLGADGSLSSLHVEPEYRRRGLAKAVARKLFRDGFRAFGDDLGGLAHADVALANGESNGVCKSLSGIDGWEVYWVRIDLDGVRKAVGGP